MSVLVDKYLQSSFGWRFERSRYIRGWNQDQNGKYFANGGRLFYIVGNGKSVIEARQHVTCLRREQSLLQNRYRLARY